MNLQGTCVISGTAKAVIVGAGSKSYVAGIAAALPSGRTKNAFDFVSPSNPQQYKDLRNIDTASWLAARTRHIKEVQKKGF